MKKSFGTKDVAKEQLKTRDIKEIIEYIIRLIKNKGKISGVFVFLTNKWLKELTISSLLLKNFAFLGSLHQ